MNTNQRSALQNPCAMPHKGGGGTEGIVYQAFKMANAEEVNYRWSCLCYSANAEELEKAAAPLPQRLVQRSCGDRMARTADKTREERRRRAGAATRTTSSNGYAPRRGNCPAIKRCDAEPPLRLDNGHLRRPASRLSTGRPKRILRTHAASAKPRRGPETGGGIEGAGGAEGGGDPGGGIRTGGDGDPGRAGVQDGRHSHFLDILYL